MRTTVSACVCLLLIGLNAACSSKSDGGNGPGAVLTAGSGGSAGSVTDSNTKGGTTSAPTAGSGGSGTAQPGGGSGSGVGGAADACANQPIVCADAMSATGCNPETGMNETFNCATELKAIGITSSGCANDPEFGDTCTIDELDDAECAAGLAPWGVCNGYTQDYAIDIYAACFLDDQMLHAPIVCYAKYYDEAAKMLDCVGAAAECDAL